MNTAVLAKNRSQRGFTLIETLVCLVIIGIISVLMMRSLVQTTARTALEAEDRMLQNSARLALSRVAKDIQGLGLDTFLTNDANDAQPKLIFAHPYQIVFNADLDQSLDVGAERRGQIRVEGFDYDFETIGDVGGAILYTPTKDYTLSGDFVNGAETIRIGLDVNFDGQIDPDEDRENEFWITSALWGGLNLNRFMSPNPLDHVLIREVYGFDPNLPTPNNRRSWEVLAIGLRPWIDGDYSYPTTNSANIRTAPLLFQYWGYFCPPDGVPLAPVECLLGEKQTDPTDAEFGRLDDQEIDDWVNGIDPRIANGKYDETFDNVDYNGDGKINRSIDEVLTKIVVTINLEAPLPGKGMNLLRSDGPTKPYYYKDVTLTQTIIPSNIRLRGTNTSGL